MREGEKDASAFHSRLPHALSLLHLLITAGIPLPHKKTLQVSEAHRLDFTTGKVSDTNRNRTAGDWHAGQKGGGSVSCIKPGDRGLAFFF